MNQSEREAVLGLPDLERAKKFKELMLRHSWNQTDLAENLKVTMQVVQPIMQLLKLCDAAQKLMDPSLPHNKSLSLVGALFLVTHTEERQLFMLEGVEDLEDRAYQRTHFKRRLEEFQQQTRDRVAGFKSHPDVIPSEHKPRLGFAGLAPRKPIQPDPIPAIRKPVDTVRSHASTEISDVAKRRADQIRTFIASREPRTVATVVDPIGKPEPVKPAPAPPPLKPAVSAVSKAAESRPAQAPTPPPRPPSPPARFASVREPAARSERPGSHYGYAPRMASAPAIHKPGLEITIEYWEEKRLFRYVLEKVEMPKYIDLWQKGLLKFQREGTDKPSYYPTLEAAIASLNS